MRRVFILFLCFCGIQAGASHIVGGEFELLHISGSSYRLNLIIYFDKLNGAAGAKDPSATVAIFRKSDNALIRNDVVLALDTESSVSYTQPECSSGEIVTDKLIYTAIITLDPEIFTEPEGYYVVWERCCRNYSITNIFSEDPAPQNGGIAAGQTFLLEFPPVVKNGKPFLNSSPRLFPPLNDYACVGRPYYVDFAGIDDDGDSLVYSLATPLNTHSAVALPALQPAPYPPVQWRDGFEVNRIIGGSPDLKISKDGLLTATPLIQGLFVFAVRVEEYRNKKLIGVSRRDFQMLVISGCADAVPPEITGPTNVSLTYTMTGDARCVTVTVSDADSQKPNHNFTEKVKIRAVGLNFTNKNLTEILPADVTETLTNGSTADFKICFPVCPFFLGGPYQVGIIAMDDACSLPLLDTLKITVNVEPPPNTDPYFTTPTETTATLRNTDQQVWPFEAFDDDGDELLVSVVTDGFVLADAGMFLSIDESGPGFVRGTFRWDAFCEIYDYTKRLDFLVTLLVDDMDECDLNVPALSTYVLNFDPPENEDPVIDTDLTPDTQERIVTNVQRRVFDLLTFDVIGTDADDDFLELDLLGTETQSVESLRNMGINFAKAVGNASVESKLIWDIKCMGLDLDSIDSFDLQFLVVDSTNTCRFYKADTVQVEVKILPPPNIGPQLVVNSLNTDVALVNNQIEMFRGNQIILGLQGADFDNSPKDLLRLELIDAKGNVPPSGFVFEPAEGEGSVSSTFSWNPDCSIFENGIYENDYTFTFSVNDQRCFNTKADTVEVTMKIKDIDGSDSGFDPNNVFTPNGDGKNDYYSMEQFNQITKVLENSLPLDNCVSQFQAIRVYNRWGKEVFSSTDRDFKWYGNGEAAGVYYYLIQYSNKEYKGALSIRY